MSNLIDLHEKARNLPALARARPSSDEASRHPPVSAGRRSRSRSRMRTAGTASRLSIKAAEAQAWTGRTPALSSSDMENFRACVVILPLYRLARARSVMAPGRGVLLRHHARAVRLGGKRPVAWPQPTSAESAAPRQSWHVQGDTAPWLLPRNMHAPRLDAGDREIVRE